MLNFTPTLLRVYWTGGNIGIVITNKREYSTKLLRLSGLKLMKYYSYNFVSLTLYIKYLVFIRKLPQSSLISFATQIFICVGVFDKKFFVQVWFHGSRLWVSLLFLLVCLFFGLYLQKDWFLIWPLVPIRESMWVGDTFSFYGTWPNFNPWSDYLVYIILVSVFNFCTLQKLPYSPAYSLFQTIVSEIVI